MKNFLITTILICAVSFGFSQNRNYWNPSSKSTAGKNLLERNSNPEKFQVYSLDLNNFKQQLQKAPMRGVSYDKANVVMTFPTSEGNYERFRIIEAPVLHPDLEERYPGIKSYAGQGIDDPSAVIRFSVSNQRGLHGMVLSGTKSTYFIDPYTDDHNEYMVYKRSDFLSAGSDFECLNEDFKLPSLEDETFEKSTDDKRLRKYRLALSCNAEYGNIFAGSGTDAQKKANILAQMNITMTRINGVYERDLAITMEIVANNDDIIYYGSTSSDPWSGEYNNKTQQVIDNAIGDANYDIGHNFNTSGSGNAGCIGCVCTSGSKGSGWTGRADPTGDPFDIDYVAHEMGHQFGGYHTMNTCSRSGSGSTEVEPASASTIMGYAGICSYNVQSNSDAYFAYVNIRDISQNIQTGTSSTCAEIINLSNNAPTANAGSDYTIPKSTAFVLKGQGSDPDGDALTYTWEQNDPEQAPGNGTPQSTWTQGPLFRSIEGTSSPDRYMPPLSNVVAGNLSNTWEVVPTVARNMEFSLTVKDNVAGGGQTADDLMNITVNGTAGPFLVTAPNTSLTWNVGQSNNVTWDVAGTSSSPVSCSNVNILLSTDGGYTYPITLASNTPNDGSQNITVPDNVSTTCRVMVEAADNIFYDISNSNFTIESAVACNPTVPTGLASSNVESTTASLNWNSVAGATYDVRYRKTGTSTWTTVSSGTASYDLTNLNTLTEYETQVRSVCTSSNSTYSSSVTFTTTEVQLVYCSSNGDNTSDEYIARVQIGSIDKSSAAGSGGYSDYTSISTDLSRNSLNDITITPTWTGTIYNEGYSVWIDYNKDGDFTDAGEQVWTKAASKTTPVSGSFTIPGTASLGSTRMRVSMQYNTIPGSCGNFNYGEVEDYTVNIIDGGGGECANTVSSFPYSLGFESGIGNWAQSTSDDLDWTVDANGTPSSSTGPSSASEGSYYIYTEASGNGTGYPNKIAILNSPCFDLTGETAASLSFDYHMYGSAMGSLTLEGSTDGTNWASLWTLSGNQGNSWSTATVNLSSYLGETLQMRYVGTTGSSYTSDITIDNLQLTTTVVDTEAPTAPGNLTASNVTGTTVDLSWNASTDNFGVTGYDVYRNGSYLATTASTGYNVTGLTNATSYSFYVKAKDAAANESGASNTVNVTTLDTEAPTAPGNLSSSNITQSGFNLSWTASSDNVGVVSYDVYVGGSLNGNTASTTYSVSGLAANTTYAVSVKAKDAASNESSASNINVTTLPDGGCSGGIASFPYSIGFESGIENWIQSSSDDINWTVDASGTPSSSTGPSSASEGSYYIYTEASGSGTGYPGKVAILTSQCIDLTSETVAVFSFDYHMYGSSMGTLRLEGSTDGTNWTSLWSMSGNQGNSWSSTNVDLSSYLGGTMELRFNGTTGSSYRSDMAVDNIQLSTSIAECVDVTLTLIFDNYPEETSWVITDSQGATVASGGTYPSEPDGSTKLETACLPAGCYTFTINDTYGDGICCSYGNGSYSLAENGTGTILASGGSFTSSDATSFCVGASKPTSSYEVMAGNTAVKARIYPNPVNDFLHVSISLDEINSIKIVSINGEVVKQVQNYGEHIDVTDFESGVYFIYIQTNNEVITKRFVKL